MVGLPFYFLERSRHMEVVKNLKIVKEIFAEKLPNQKFDLMELLLFSTPYNRTVFFIGQNIEGKTTLFKHSKTDKVFYDVLDRNLMYDNNNISEVKNLEYLLIKEKKERRYNYDS